MNKMLLGKATTKISNEFYQRGQFLEDFLKT